MRSELGQTDEDASTPGVQVAVEDAAHVWTLAEWPIAELAFDPGAVRIAVRDLSGSAEIRVASRFRLRTAAGQAVLDPAETATLAPLLGLMGAPLQRIRVGADGFLELLVGAATITVAPDPRFEAWEATGAGVFDGLGYLCPAGGGPPWSAP